MMDAHSNQLTVKQTDMTRSQLKRNKKEKKKKKNSSSNSNDDEKPLKVVYIANPLRVTLNASEFKEKVQKLTGRHSEIADIMFQQSVLQATDHSPELYDEKEEALCPLASTDVVQGSTSTMSSSGASPDPSKDDFTLFEPYYDMAMGSPFTDLYSDTGFRRGYFDE